MPTLIELEDMQGGYIELVNVVRNRGRLSYPRGMETLELQDVVFTVDDLTNTLPTRVNRKPSLKIAAIEALQLIGGVSTPQLTIAASPNFAQFREIDGNFWGAYGMRISSQSQYVVDKLKADADSRQAVITLWNPVKDNVEGKKDYPCTIALGFRIRHDKLNLSVTMRSNDVWWGTTYDVFQFTQLQHTIANLLEIEVGTYTHMAWSLHLYERDYDRSSELQPPFGTSFIPSGLDGFDTAANILAGQLSDPDGEPPSPSQRWYEELIEGIYKKINETDVG